MTHQFKRHLKNSRQLPFLMFVLGVLTLTAFSWNTLDSLDNRTDASYPNPNPYIQTQPPLRQPARPIRVPDPVVNPDADIIADTCSQTGGTWESFATSCADTCQGQQSDQLCQQTKTYSCNCGLDKCWNGYACVDNPTPQLSPNLTDTSTNH